MLPKKLEGALFFYFPAIFAVIVMIKFVVELTTRKVPGNQGIDAWHYLTVAIGYLTVAIVYSLIANWVANTTTAINKLHRSKQAMEVRGRL